MQDKQTEKNYPSLLRAIFRCNNRQKKAQKQFEVIEKMATKKVLCN